MKFVHIADMHFDIPFTSLNTREGLGEKRRLEQRNVFKKVINYIKDNSIEYFFIAGDLYEHEYVKKSTIEFIINCFHEIPNTKVFITPGNHDPYIKGSYYETYNFGDNVCIFNKSQIEKYEDKNVNIYGLAFTEFYMEESPLLDVYPENNTKVNILISHCDLNGGKDADGFSYNPILESKLNALEFDYIAIGHIHKNNIETAKKAYYPGSPISLGFDELGKHGMIVGEINKDSFDIEFVPLDSREFKVVEIDVTNFASREDLVENLLDINLERKNLYKFVLTGYRNFEIDVRQLLKAVNIENVLKIKDCTKISYDVEELAKQNNLKGIFVREAIKVYNSGQCTEEELQKAIEIGLDVMK